MKTNNIVVKFTCNNGFTSEYITKPINLSMLCYMLDHEELVRHYTVEYNNELKTKDFFMFGANYPKWIL